MHSNPIDQTMEKASQALADRDYFTCETICLEALAKAKEANDYERFARILMPLQEVRRMRRQCAEDAGCSILTEKLSVEELLAKYPAGCLVLASHAYTETDAGALKSLAFENKANIEVLFLQAEEAAGLKELEAAELQAWFCAKLEAIGDAKLAALNLGEDASATVEGLYGLLPELGDHEIAHQTLAKAAKACLLV